MADLRSELENAKQRAGTETIHHIDSMMCTLIEARPRGSREEPYWIQLHSGMLNMQYLHAEDPIGVIFQGVGELPDSVELTGWEKELFCTFDIGSLNDEQTWALVRVMLHSYYGLGDDFEWAVKLEDLDSP